jgi:hypothetical protein
MSSSMCINDFTYNQTYPTTLPSSPIDDGMLRATKYGYDSTIHIIRFLLDEMNTSKFEDERCEIAGKMFDILNKNPNILIYEPKFREVVINKLNEVQDHINKRSDKFQIEKQQKIIRMMEISVQLDIHNSAMRHKIYKHLNDINTILKSYKDWASGDSLKNKINQLYLTLEHIKRNPSYISL